MKVRIKDGVNLEELRKYGFKTGKEWADEGERCLAGKGYEYQHEWYHKFLMTIDEDLDPDSKEHILYADDEYDQPMVQITVRTEHRDLYIECTPSGTYHIGGSDLDIISKTIFDLTSDGLLEVVDE